VKKRAVLVALCGWLFCAPAHAKTFVGVLWPMFGPLPAIGLVELVAEIRMMPDVEVKTYLHQEWPELVEDLARQSKGTRTIVIGYSLGANASVSVANKSKYVDEIIALQPSMLSWNPDLTGTVGKMIEVYNPNPWETFGGMGSKKLVGNNIQYIENHDSHPGAQFDPDFRSLVKTEIAKLTAQGNIEVAQADAPSVPKAPDPPKPADPAKLQAQLPLQPKLAERPRPAEQPTKLAEQSAPAEQPKQAERLKPADQPKLAAQSRQPEQRKQVEQVRFAEAADRSGLAKLASADMSGLPAPQALASGDLTAFLESLSNSVDSGDLSTPRRLTRDDMVGYAQRTYVAAAQTADNSAGR
jgi:hypothetical protein